MKTYMETVGGRFLMVVMVLASCGRDVVMSSRDAGSVFGFGGGQFLSGGGYVTIGGGVGGAIGGGAAGGSAAGGWVAGGPPSGGVAGGGAAGGSGGATGSAGGAACAGLQGLQRCTAGCPSSVFASRAAVHDFSTASSLVGWTPGQFLAPHVTNRVLRLGPHPLSNSWWENYTSAWSSSDMGDVLLCAELSLQADNVSSASDNTVEIVMRRPAGSPFETSGMALLLQPNGDQAVLRTRVAADVWETFGAAPFPFANGVSTRVSVLLYANQDRFVAVLSSGGTFGVLRARRTFPIGGQLALVGWRIPVGIDFHALSSGDPRPELRSELELLLP